MNRGYNHESLMIIIPAPCNRLPCEMDSAEPAINPIQLIMIKLFLEQRQARSLACQRSKRINPYRPQCGDQHCDPAEQEDRDHAEKVDLQTARLDFEEQVLE